MAKAKYTKQKNGYWQALVWDGTFNPDGSKHRKILRSTKSSADLEKKVNELKTQVFNRQYLRETEMSFYQYAVAWEATYKANAQLNTRKMYQNIIEKYLKDLTMPVGSIYRGNFVACLNSAAGPRTQQQIAMVFKQVVRSAVRDRFLPGSIMDDLFDDIKVKYKSPEKRPLTPAEKAALQKADFTLREKAFVFLIYGCGLRRGEAIALTRFDINTAKKELTVSKAIAFDVNTPILKDTKNYVHRTVPIPDITMDVLQEYMNTVHGSFLFSMSNGGYITKSSLDKMWRQIVKKMQLVSDEPIEGLTPHIFRHNYCASLCYQIPAISIKKIAALLGDSEKMVVEVYNHEVEEKEKPAETVAQALAL